MNLQEIQDKQDLIVYLKEMNTNNHVRLTDADTASPSDLAGFLGSIIANYDLFELTEEAIREYDAMTKRVFTEEEF